MFSVDGGWVDLEISGVDDQSRGRSNRQREGIHDRMRYRNELHSKGTQLDRVTRVDLVQYGVSEQPVVVQFPFDQFEGERAAVDGDVQVRQYKRQCSDVIFVPVREHDRFHLFTVVQQEGDVRDDDVDTQQLLFREEQAAVHNDNRVLGAERHDVHSELA